MDRVSKLAKQLLITLGVLTTVGLLLSLTVPRAVHAAVAALVQVVNTPANPVPNQEVTLSAAQTVGIFCPVSSAVCNQVLPGGGVATATYTVPAGQNLVITEFDVTTQAGSGNCFFGVSSINFSTGTSISPSVLVPNDGLTHQFFFRNGIVWPASGVISPVGCGSVNAIVRGYLTPI